MKKILSIVLVFLLTFSVVPVGINLTASADTTTATSGTTGDCTWTLNGTELTISGNGKMEDYSGGTGPWGTNITKVIIENDVTSIGNYAFEHCKGLTSITIPDGVTSIGDDAFESCTGLTSVIIGNSVTSIGGGAFRYCSMLTSIPIPNSVTSIGDDAFPNDCVIWCNRNSAAATFATTNNYPYVYFDSCDEETLVSGKIAKYNWTLDKRTGVLKLTGSGNMADFHIVGNTPWHEYGAYITSLELPNTLTNIGDGAFKGLYKLQNVVVPDSVTSIGDYAFGDCTRLASITIPDGVTSIGASAFYNTAYFNNDNNWENCILYIGNYLIEAKTNVFALAFSNIKQGTKIIASSAFQNCRYLTSVTFPDSITSIGDYAFRDCTNLTSITIPDGVTSIGASAFYNTAYYNNKDNWENNVLYIGNYLIEAKTNITSCNIKQGTKIIASSVFSRCDELTSITIPNSVTSIGNSAFSGCDGLTSITIPSSVTFIGDGAFENCTGLANVAIPDSVTSIGEYAFRFCVSLTSIMIGNGVAYIGDFAFFNGPASITVNKDNLRYSSQDGVLFNKSKTQLICYPVGKTVTSYTIPESVITIGNYAFEFCTGLTSVTIPDSVTSIGEYAFLNCPASITVNKDNLCYSSQDGVLFNKSKTQLICYPVGKTATSYTIPNSVTSINYGAFYGCTGLTSITIPYKVSRIYQSAFEGCNSLKEVYIYNENCKFDDFCGLYYNQTIYGVKGSTAEKYADEIGAEFIDIMTVHSHTYTNSCDIDCDVCRETRNVNHSYNTTTSKATTYKNGSIVKKCSVCGKIKSSTTIKYAKTFKLSATSYTYDGKTKKPTVKVYDSAGKTISSSNYTVTYATGRKNVGVYKVTIKFKGTYSGSKTLTFKINPKKTSVSKVTAGKKSLKVSIKKQTKEVTGYEIQYSTSKKFTKSTTKTATVKKAKTTSLTIKKLKAKKTYYVRVRTYKIAKGKKYYSAWSGYKSAKTKK